MLRKLLAFLGLLGVIYALALQHGVFDRAQAAVQPPQPQPIAATPRHSKAAAKCTRQKC